MPFENVWMSAKETSIKFPRCIDPQNFIYAKYMSLTGSIRILRNLALGAWAFQHNIVEFINYIRRSAEAHECIVKRLDADQGEPDRSMATLMAAEAIPDALAGWDFDRAASMALRLGTDLARRREDILPIWYGLFRCYSALVLPDGMVQLSVERRDIEMTLGEDFAGLVAAILAVGRRDAPSLNAALPLFLSGFRRQCKLDDSPYKPWMEDLLCLDGLAVINAARRAGMTVDVDDPLVPRPLWFQP